MYDFHYILHSFSKQLTGCAGDVTGIGIALASTTLLTNLFTNRESIRYFFCTGHYSEVFCAKDDN